MMSDGHRVVVVPVMRLAQGSRGTRRLSSEG
jgi:hypothetical protein